MGNSTSSNNSEDYDDLIPQIKIKYLSYIYNNQNNDEKELQKLKEFKEKEFNEEKDMKFPEESTEEIEDEKNNNYYFVGVVSYKRYCYKIIKNIKSFQELRKILLLKYKKKYYLRLKFPIIKYKENLKFNEKLNLKGKLFFQFIENISAINEIFNDLQFRTFLEIGMVTF